MKEHQIQAEIELGVGALPHVRVFRQNVGQAWVGAAKKSGNIVTIENPRPFHGGLCKGSSDLIGWRSIRITPEMVGLDVAVFVAIECKTETGKATAEQVNFIERVRLAGGLAGIARSVEDALKIISPDHLLSR
jgi:hypothetical protein